jgi:hypothetical protein
VFEAMIRAIHWPEAPAATPESDEPGITVMNRVAAPANATTYSK